ncbi:ribonuclease III [Ahniella affigens]|uniref:Ribonuclease 3 n=1 Tax=Ahniella affigens TaxID=2021234 RepID=A0A2P1PSK4_9GAMM|nr:ribonuclease III [Ahniella affigens]AVP97802.1 ribonuclease III [Ahniella affigens]
MTAELHRQALTHRSAGQVNNERLEFLGDALVNFVVADELFRRFPKVDEGTLTRMRAALVRESALAELARELDLGAKLILGPGELKSGGHRRDSILADAVEALAAATYVQQGLDAATQLVRDWFAPRVAALDPAWHGKDGKTRLQEWLQAKGLGLPAYQLIAAEGPEHAKTFEVSCEVEALQQKRHARGHSRKLAETRAAEALLAELEKKA